MSSSAFSEESFDQSGRSGALLNEAFNDELRLPNTRAAERRLRPLLQQGAMVAAPALLGCLLVRRSQRGLRAGRIGEVEAYTQDDPAAHTYVGRTARNAPMFGRAGTVYVYFSYGMHWCMNIVAGPEHQGEAVLIRGIEPVAGSDLMIEARRWQGKPSAQMSNGPGKVCQALEIDKSFNWMDLFSDAELSLYPAEIEQGEVVEITPRIGITKAADWPRRFFLRRK